MIWGILIGFAIAAVVAFIAVLTFGFSIFRNW